MTSVLKHNIASRDARHLRAHGDAAHEGAQRYNPCHEGETESVTPYSQRAQNRALRVIQIHREWLQAKDEMIAIAERCSMRGWPDRRLAIQNAFRLQILFNEREALRLEHLVGHEVLEIKTGTSLTSISERLTKEWNSTEEAELNRSSARYREVLLEIDRCQIQLDPDALDGPFKDVQRDRQYQAARRDIQRKQRDFDQELNGK
jgi:hypothetical protein